MAKARLEAEVRVQRWKLLPCIWVIEILLMCGLVDEDRAADLAYNAARNSIKVRLKMT